MSSLRQFYVFVSSGGLPFVDCATYLLGQVPDVWDMSSCLLVVSSRSGKAERWQLSLTSGLYN